MYPQVHVCPPFGSKRMDSDFTIVDPMWVMNRVSDRIRSSVGVHELVASLFLELLLVSGAQDGKLILPGDIRKSNFEFPPAYIDLVRDALADQEVHRRDFGVSRRVVAMPLVMRHRCHAVLLLVWEGNAFIEEQKANGNVRKSLDAMGLTSSMVAPAGMKAE